jgi:hypothetical protein
MYVLYCLILESFAMHGGLAFKPAKKLVFDKIGYVKIQETEVYS